MSHELEFIFKTRDVKRLVETESEFIVIRSFLKAVTLADGTKAGALEVYADAVNRGQMDAIESIKGCPRPPCDIDDPVK